MLSKLLEKMVVQRLVRYLPTESIIYQLAWFIGVCYKKYPFLMSVIGYSVCCRYFRVHVDASWLDSFFLWNGNPQRCASPKSINTAFNNCSPVCYFQFVDDFPINKATRGMATAERALQSVIKTTLNDKVYVFCYKILMYCL